MRTLDRVGRATSDFFEYAGGLAVLSGESLGFLLRLRIRLNETIAQCALLGVQSLVIVLLTSLFTGMVISLESAQQAVAYGFTTFVGGAVAYASVRELGPMLTAVVVAGRVGAAIAAELGSMVVTEQIEALRSMGLEPARFLVVPRLLALLVMLPLLTVFADIVSVVGRHVDRARVRAYSIRRVYDVGAPGDRLQRHFAGLAQDARFCGHHRYCGRVSRTVDDRRRGGRRESDDVFGRVVDHFDFCGQLRAIVSALRHDVTVQPRNLVARMDGVSLSFGNRIVLKNCSLEVVEGAITCIVGLSGAGKSTVLRLLDGLIRPGSGQVRVLGNDLTSMTEEQINTVRHKISLSFQFAALLDSLTVGENVALPLRERTKLSNAEIERTAMEALLSVGLAHAYNDLPAELSGGMLKRAGFARAIVTRPELILYDEPTTGLDPIVTKLITETILRLRQKFGGTAVVISHDLPSIFAMADYIGMLFEGAIIAFDTAERIRNSENPIVQQFLAGSETGPIPI